MKLPRYNEKRKKYITKDEFNNVYWLLFLFIFIVGVIVVISVSIITNENTRRISQLEESLQDVPKWECHEEEVDIENATKAYKIIDCGEYIIDFDDYFIGEYTIKGPTEGCKEEIKYYKEICEIV